MKLLKEQKEQVIKELKEMGYISIRVFDDGETQYSNDTTDLKVYIDARGEFALQISFCNNYILSQQEYKIRLTKTLLDYETLLLNVATIKLNQD